MYRMAFEQQVSAALMRKYRVEHPEEFRQEIERQFKQAPDHPDTWPLLLLVIITITNTITINIILLILFPGDGSKSTIIVLLECR